MTTGFFICEKFEFVVFFVLSLQHKMKFGWFWNLGFNWPFLSILIFDQLENYFDLRSALWTARGWPHLQNRHLTADKSIEVVDQLIEWLLIIGHEWVKFGRDESRVRMQLASLSESGCSHLCMSKVVEGGGQKQVREEHWSRLFVRGSLPKQGSHDRNRLNFVLEFASFNCVFWELPRISKRWMVAASAVHFRLRFQKHLILHSDSAFVAQRRFGWNCFWNFVFISTQSKRKSWKWINWEISRVRELSFSGFRWKWFKKEGINWFKRIQAEKEADQETAKKSESKYYL
jgi:hypothetical protein